MADKTYKIRIKKGDTVMVRAGKYKGKTGKVLATHPKTNSVTVEGLNIVTRHRKPTPANPQPGSVELTRPFPVGKVGYYDSAKKRPSSIAYKLGKPGQKKRQLKTSGKEIS